ncbi:MAG: hypothetical protein GXP62_03540, partial [Oligoflexia bacterium]|nr:hypothetical protein [Oligoflexia bacterium]
MAHELIQILSNCPACRVESAVVELVELDDHDSRVVDARCRLCGLTSHDGQIVAAGQRFTSRDQIDAALTAWARAEGEDDVDAFIASGFGARDRAGVFDALLAGQPVQTNFDVVAWLFPGMGMGVGASRAIADGALLADPADLARCVAVDLAAGLAADLAADLAVAAPPDLAPAACPAPDVGSPPDARVVAIKALAAVMLADGQVRPGERAFLEGFASRAGLLCLDPSWVRAWRPMDLGLVADPEPILHAMIDLAFIDRQRDHSEWRVVREFARHWGYPLARLEALGRHKDDEI